MMLSASFFCYSQNRGYEGSVKVRGALDFNNDEDFIGVSTTHGYRFNNYIFVGGGIGFDYAKYDSPIRIKYGDSYKEVEDQDQIISPVFISFKANFTKSKVSPFFLMETGYVIGKSEDDAVKTSGMFAQPSVGIDINLGAERKYAIFTEVGININENKNLLTWELEKKSRIKLALEVGFRF